MGRVEPTCLNKLVELENFYSWCGELVRMVHARSCSQVLPFMFFPAPSMQVILGIHRASSCVACPGSWQGLEIMPIFLSVLSLSLQPDQYHERRKSTRNPPQEYFVLKLLEMIGYILNKKLYILVFCPLNSCLKYELTTPSQETLVVFIKCFTTYLCIVFLLTEEGHSKRSLVII